MADNETMTTIADGQTAVIRLDSLLQKLFPEPGPDILTLADFQRRYPLTELGPLATAAIARTQRVNRAISNNYSQIGLAEFAIGLIYASKDGYLAAAQQFTEARRQWAFVDHAAAACLSYTGEGYMFFLAHRYEDAMICLGKAEKRLQRLQLTTPSALFLQFVEQISPLIQELMTAVREAIWQAEEQGVDADPPLPPHKGKVDRPISNLESASAAQVCPIPDHQKFNSQFEWFEVTIRLDKFLPNIVAGSWLLVNRETAAYPYRLNELVLIHKPAQEASIFVRSRHSQDSHARICLAEFKLTGRFTRDPQSGEVTIAQDQHQIPISLDQIVGVVIGWWVPVKVKVGA